MPKLYLKPWELEGRHFEFENICAAIIGNRKAIIYADSYKQTTIFVLYIYLFGTFRKYFIY